MLKELNEAEIECVSGGTSMGCGCGGGESDYWADQLLRYKMGQPNVFGNSNTYTPLPGE